LPHCSWVLHAARRRSRIDVRRIVGGRPGRRAGARVRGVHRRSRRPRHTQQLRPCGAAGQQLQRGDAGGREGVPGARRSSASRSSAEFGRRRSWTPTTRSRWTRWTRLSKG